MAATVVVASCSVHENEIIGQSAAAISVAPNYPAVLLNMHEVEVAKAKFPGSSQWHWVAAFNNCSNSTPSLPTNQCDPYGMVASSSSSDLTGASWTPNVPAPGWEEVNWIPPYTPTGGGSFAGWRGDPSIATIGNPPDGEHVIYSNVVASTNAPTSDIATLLSGDGGQSWGTPQYISLVAGGGDTDQPQIASNASWPYSTIATWTSGATTLTSAVGYINSIDNVSFQPGSSSQYPLTWNVPTGTGPAHGAKKILNSANNIRRAKIAVATIPWKGTGCTGVNQHEIVYVAWSDTLYGTGCNHPATAVSWRLAIFDNTANAWAPNTYDLATDPAWPYCVANGVFNNANPYLATYRNSVAVVHNRSSSLGTRIEVNGLTVTCNNNEILTTGAVTSWVAPDPCYTVGGPTWCGTGHTGGNGADGGNVVNDQWGARVAFQFNGAQYMLVTWYDTNGDQANTMVKVNGAINTNGILGNPFRSGTTPTIYQVSQASGSPAGQAVPWSATLAPWWDYQGIGVDTTSHTFLAAWGGDARLVNSSANGPSGIWTALVATP